MYTQQIHLAVKKTQYFIFVTNVNSKSFPYFHAYMNLFFLNIKKIVWQGAPVGLLLFLIF